MTAPAAKAVTKRVAKKAGPKKLAQTRPAHPAKKAPAKKAVTPAKKSVKARVVESKVGRAGAKTGRVVNSTFDNPLAPRQKPLKSVVTYRHIIAFEFWVGIIILLTKPGEDAQQAKKAGTYVQIAAFILTMAILFGITAFGANAAKFAAALGGLILLTLLVKTQGTGEKRFGVFQKASRQGVGLQKPSWQGVGSAVGQAAAGAANSAPNAGGGGGGRRLPHTS